MKIRDDLFIMILAATWLFLSGCQESSSLENRPKNAAALDASSVKGDGNTTEEFGVDEPISVAGAFLFCAFDDRITASSADRSVVGCRLQDRHDEPIVLKKDFEVTATLVSADGTERQIKPLAIKKFWDWIYEEPTSDLAGGTIEMFSDAEGVIWGDRKAAQIAGVDNDVRNQHRQTEVWIIKYENSLHELREELDYRTRRLKFWQIAENQANAAKTNASRALQSATSQHKRAKDDYGVATRAVTSTTTQLSTAVSEREKVTRDLAAAQAVLATADQAVIDAPTPENIIAAETARTVVQATQTNLINATAKELQMRQLLEDSIVRSNEMKAMMDEAETQRNNAQDDYNIKLSVHQVALSALERATRKHEEALAARDKVAGELADLQAELERLRIEIERKSL